MNYFREQIEDEVHSMICGYDLDADRDTEEEVKAVISVFPEVLSRRNDDGYYPMEVLLGKHYKINLKAISFLPLLAKLGIEHGQFQEEQRGGLIVQNEEEEEELGDQSVLKILAGGSFCDHKNDVEYLQLVDARVVGVLRQLRTMNLLRKKDIYEHNLLWELSNGMYFPEKRFRFLVDLDPTFVVHSTTFGRVPLHRAAYRSSIQQFQLVFEAGIRYYPKHIGIRLLFYKDRNAGTPFQIACKEHGKEEVMKVIESTLRRYWDCHYDTAHPLILAAIDRKIDLDCVYFLLRREPDVLQKLLSSAGSPCNDCNGNGNGDGNGIDNNDEKESSTTTTANPRKRKQK